MNIITSKKPKENSIPAKANIKKLVESNDISSLTEPKKIVKQYKHSHVISENINKFKKFVGLNKKQLKLNQKKNNQN